MCVCVIDFHTHSTLLLAALLSPPTPVCRYHYSDSLSKIHARTTRNSRAAHAAAATIQQREAVCRKFNQRALSFQAELAGLPNSMSVVSQTITTLYNLRDGIHAVEAELGRLESLIEEVELHRVKARQPLIIAECVARRSQPCFFVVLFA
jgi:hypothetical protein